jgi:hypothetical protein
MFRRQLIHCLMVAMLFLVNLCGLRGSPISRYDDDLSRFEKAGAKPLPQAVRDGYVGACRREYFVFHLRFGSNRHLASRRIGKQL